MFNRRGSRKTWRQDGWGNSGLGSCARRGFYVAGGRWPTLGTKTMTSGLTGRLRWGGGEFCNTCWPRETGKK